MIYLPLLLIPLIFVVTILSAPKVRGVELCAVCSAVSGTWIILLVMLYLDFPLASSLLPPIIGIMMGMSVVGMLSKAEPWMIKNNIQHIKWIKIITIIGGLYTIYFLLQQEWQRLIVSVILTLLALIIIGFLMQGKHRHKHDTEKHLDNCC